MLMTPNRPSNTYMRTPMKAQNDCCPFSSATVETSRNPKSNIQLHESTSVSSCGTCTIQRNDQWDIISVLSSFNLDFYEFHCSHKSQKSKINTSDSVFSKMDNASVNRNQRAGNWRDQCILLLCPVFHLLELMHSF